MPPSWSIAWGSLHSLILLPAGMSRIPLGKFLLFTGLGTALWNVELGAAGYVLGENRGSVLASVNQWEWLAC